MTKKLNIFRNKKEEHVRCQSTELNGTSGSSNEYWPNNGTSSAISNYLRNTKTNWILIKADDIEKMEFDTYEHNNEKSRHSKGR